MEKRSKAETFIGFAVKARKLVTGSDSVKRLKKAYLVLVCNSAAENAKKLAQNLSAKFSCPLLECKIPLENLCNKSNCKIAAVTDTSLAKAIIDNRDETLFLCPEGVGR